MSTEDAIMKLNGGQARRILEIVARHHRAAAPAPDPIEALTPALRSELAAAFGLTDAASPPVAEEELARQALLVLAEDPATAAAIQSMAAQPAGTPQKFDFGASLAVSAAVLIVLQTHLQFERHKDGTWTLKLEKKPTSDALLKGLVQKLLGYMK